jgi:hypothetical protein
LCEQKKFVYFPRTWVKSERDLKENDLVPYRMEVNGVDWWVLILKMQYLLTREETGSIENNVDMGSQLQGTDYVWLKYHLFVFFFFSRLYNREQTKLSESRINVYLDDIDAKVERVESSKNDKMLLVLVFFFQQLYLICYYPSTKRSFRWNMSLRL